ncbi:hypothetical protein BH23CHL7_BH23CHL7_13520 [soil metagenome]
MSHNSGRYYQAAGQTDDEWILDIGGERHDMAFTTGPNTPADLVAEMEAIRDSLVIEPL